MFAYVLLNAAFLGPVTALAVLAWRSVPNAQRRPTVTRMALALVVVIAATAVFDNLLIAAGIVAYDADLTLGLRIGLAPVEDFAYTLAAVVGLASLWRLLGLRTRRTAETSARPHGR